MCPSITLIICDRSILPRFTDLSWDSNVSTFRVVLGTEVSETGTGLSSLRGAYVSLHVVGIAYRAMFSFLYMA